MSVLDLIRSITSNRESGRLEINAAGTPGTLLFHEGKLVDARLGSLSGFQAVNAAVALRDAEVSFDHVVPALHVSTITPSERVILSRFFGIEAADVEQPKEAREPEIDWNPAPEPVVPLTRARSIPFAFFSRPRFAVVCLALLLGVTVGAVVLRSKVKTLQQSGSVASAVESESSSAPESQAVPESQPEVKQVAAEPAPVPVSPQKDAPARSDSPAPIVAAARPQSAERNENVQERDANVPQRDDAEERDGNVQDLTGEWRVINTVERTAYKSFGNMRVGFRLTISQNGKEFTATGEKFSENGQTLPVARRTPITVQGSIDGDKVVATFTEDGRMRRTNGRFVWKVKNGNDGLAGTFVSNAAKSSGRSTVSKEH